MACTVVFFSLDDSGEVVVIVVVTSSVVVGGPVVDSVGVDREVVTSVVDTVVEGASVVDGVLVVMTVVVETGVVVGIPPAHPRVSTLKVDSDALVKTTNVTLTTECFSVGKM